ncbi:hypothetical protein Q7P37_011415 [Cladosporium fusiforme]
MNSSRGKGTTTQARQPRVFEEQVVEDADSSSATRGSASTTDEDECDEPEDQKSDDVDARIDQTTNGGCRACSDQHLASSQPCKHETHLKDGHRLSKATALYGRHDYSLDRFVEDIDPREKTRLGNLGVLAHSVPNRFHNEPEKDVNGFEVAAKAPAAMQDADECYAEEADEEGEEEGEDTAA